MTAEESMYCVKFNSDQWRLSQSSCPFYLKNNICKHIIGLAATYSLVDIPDVAKDLPLDKARTKGRPKKTARRALLAD